MDTLHKGDDDDDDDDDNDNNNNINNNNINHYNINKGLDSKVVRILKLFRKLSSCVTTFRGERVYCHQ